MKCLSMDHEIIKVWVLVLVYIGVTSGVLLNGKCDVDTNCGTLDSFCKNGTCACIENFTTFEDSCVKVIIPKKQCNNNVDCKFRSRSMCTRGICTCRPFHHEENGQCIKSRVLDEPCDKDFQCYWGERMKSKMGCVEGKCSCKPGYTTTLNYKGCTAIPVTISSSPRIAPILVPLFLCVKLII